MLGVFLPPSPHPPLPRLLVEEASVCPFSKLVRGCPLRPGILSVFPPPLCIVPEDDPAPGLRKASKVSQ